MENAGTERLNAGEAGIARAASLMNAGKLVAFPTETVYGLGARADDAGAVAGIFAAKDRPSFNPLIAHVPDVETARALAEFDEDADRLAMAFWPGPLTLVLPLKQGAGIARLALAGLPTIAVRVPGTALARDLLVRTGAPVVAPSANPSGRLSPTTADHVLADLDGRIAAVLDGGACGVGVESTIVATTPVPTLLRPGGLPAEAVEACLGLTLDVPTLGSAPTSPGQLASHYAPRVGLRLNAEGPVSGEQFLGFGSMSGDQTLSASGDLTEAAARLFDILHEMERQDCPIAVAPIPDTGLGRAINDRLRRAAAPRP